MHDRLYVKSETTFFAVGLLMESVVQIFLYGQASNLCLPCTRPKKNLINFVETKYLKRSDYLAFAFSVFTEKDPTLPRNTMRGLEQNCE